MPSFIQIVLLLIVALIICEVLSNMASSRISFHSCFYQMIVIPIYNVVNNILSYLTGAMVHLYCNQVAQCTYKSLSFNIVCVLIGLWIFYKLVRWVIGWFGATDIQQGPNAPPFNGPGHNNSPFNGAPSNYPPFIPPQNSRNRPDDQIVYCSGVTNDNIRCQRHRRNVIEPWYCASHR